MYITKALEVVFDGNLSSLNLRMQAPFVNPTSSSPVNMKVTLDPNLPASNNALLAGDASLAKSAFYVMLTGWRSLLSLLQGR